MHNLHSNDTLNYTIFADSIVEEFKNEFAYCYCKESALKKYIKIKAQKDMSSYFDTITDFFEQCGLGHVPNPHKLKDAEIKKYIASLPDRQQIQSQIFDKLYSIFRDYKKPGEYMERIVRNLADQEINEGSVRLIILKQIIKNLQKDCNSKHPEVRRFIRDIKDSYPEIASSQNIMDVIDKIDESVFAHSSNTYLLTDTDKNICKKFLYGVIEDMNSDLLQEEQAEIYEQIKILLENMQNKTFLTRKELEYLSRINEFILLPSEIFDILPKIQHIVIHKVENSFNRLRKETEKLKVKVIDKILSSQFSDYEISLFTGESSIFNSLKIYGEIDENIELAVNEYISNEQYVSIEPARKLCKNLISSAVKQQLQLVKEILVANGKTFSFANMKQIRLESLDSTQKKALSATIDLFTNMYKVEEKIAYAQLLQTTPEVISELNSMSANLSTCIDNNPEFRSYIMEVISYCENLKDLPEDFSAGITTLSSHINEIIESCPTKMQMDIIEKFNNIVKTGLSEETKKTEADISEEAKKILLDFSIMFTRSATRDKGELNHSDKTESGRKSILTFEQMDILKEAIDFINNYSDYITLCDKSTRLNQIRMLLTDSCDDIFDDTLFDNIKILKNNIIETAQNLDTNMLNRIDSFLLHRIHLIQNDMQLIEALYTSLQKIPFNNNWHEKYNNFVSWLNNIQLHSTDNGILLSENSLKLIKTAEDLATCTYRMNGKTKKDLYLFAFAFGLRLYPPRIISIFGTETEIISDETSIVVKIKDDSTNNIEEMEVILNGEQHIKAERYKNCFKFNIDSDKARAYNNDILLIAKNKKGMETSYSLSLKSYSKYHDIEKFFWDTYNDNIFRYLEKYNFIDNSSRPNVDGINYKNYSEVISLYYLSSDDINLSKYERYLSAKSCIDFCRENPQNTELPDGTLVYKRMYLTEIPKINDDEKLKQFICSHFRITSPTYVSTNEFGIYGDKVTANNIYEEHLQYLAFQNETEEDIRTTILDGIDNNIDQRFLDCIKAIENMLDINKSTNEQNITRTDFIILEYFRSVSDNIQLGCSFSELLADFADSVNEKLEASRFQPISAKNFFDLYVVCLLYLECI